MITPEGFIARDAIVRCEAMAAFAASARGAVEAHDVPRLSHAIDGMRLTLEDLEQYRDAAGGRTPTVDDLRAALDEDEREV